MIDPSIWSDDGMAELTPRQQLLYIGLFSNADDDGRLKGSPVAIRLMMPAVYAGASLDEIDADLCAVLSQMRKVVRYCVDGRAYLAFENYRHWQKIDKPYPSTLPDPAHSTNDSRTVDELEKSRPVAVALNRIEGNRREEPPTVVAPVEPVAAPSPPAERAARPVPKPKEREKSWLEKHPLFPALVAIPEIGRPAGDAWSLYGKAVKTLEEYGATPEEIPKRAENYPRVMGAKEDGTPIPLTLTSLVKHWNLCGQAPRIQPKESRNGELLGPTQDDRRRAEEKRRAEAEAYRAALSDLNGHRPSASGVG